MAQSTTEQAKTARPYAEAVFKRAQESGTLSAWSEQLLLLATIAADEQMQGLIRNPRIARSQAAEVLLDVAAEGVDTEGRNLVHLLARNGRTGLLPEIQRVFEARKLESEGSVDVTIYSAYKVTQAQENPCRCLEEAFGQGCQCDQREGPEPDRWCVDTRRRLGN